VSTGGGEVVTAIPECYESGAPRWRHGLTDGALVATTIASVTAARAASPAVAVVLAIALALLVRVFDFDVKHWMLVVVLLVAVTSAWRAQVEWQRLSPRQLGPFAAAVRVVEEPKTYGRATRVIVDVDGERFEAWFRGTADQLRARGWRGGDRVTMVGDRRRLTEARAARVAWQHVVGEVRPEWAGDVRPGGPIDRASNRVRAAIERGAAVMPPDDAALFRGLVVGDDRAQSDAMIERFRASGLSHLTAVSGQNVSFVLAAAGPLLRVLRPWWRWVVTVALVAWFVSLTRFEPSIVRAGVMAAISATAFVLGRERAPARVLCSAIVILMVIDPLLVRSVGFWLSVGATAGVCTVGPWLAARLSPLGFLAPPLGITLGAQVGVVIPLVWAFGRLPLVSVPANLLAVPVAGFVMLYGLPAGLVAGLVPWLAPFVMAPALVGVRWVDSVAALASRVEPAGAFSWAGWALVVVAVVAIAAKNRGRHGRATPLR
jgi:competence protein ComEC